MTTYTTIQGDTWDAVSFRVFGDERFMSRIMHQNPEHIGVSVFPAGVVLFIPEIDTAEIGDSLPPWMR